MWRGLIHIYVIALVRAITVTIAKNGMNEISLEYNIWYSFRTHILRGFWFWSQNFNITSVSSATAIFVLNHIIEDLLYCSKCYSCYNFCSCCQRVVPYAYIISQKSLHQPSMYYLCYRLNSVHAHFGTNTIYFSRIPWQEPPSKILNTSHKMCIVRLKRVYIKIPSITECRHKTVLEVLWAQELSEYYIKQSGISSTVLCLHSVIL